MTETDHNASAQIIPLMMLTDKDVDHHADALNMLIITTFAKDVAMDNSLTTPDTDVPPELTTSTTNAQVTLLLELKTTAMVASNALLLKDQMPVTLHA